MEFESTADLHRLSELDVILICAPARLSASRVPDLTAVTRCIAALATHLRCGQLIVPITPLPPGTTRRVFLPLLGAGGREPGRDFFLAYSPNSQDRDCEISSRAVGGADPASLEAAATVFGCVHSTVIRVSSLDAAELCGLLGSVTRAVIAALAIELRQVCNRMGVDDTEVFATSNNRFSGLEFGPASSGDLTPTFVTWGVRRYGISSRLIDLAQEVNASMLALVMGKVAEAPNDAGKPMKGSRVLIMGMAETKLDDPRESYGFALMDLLLRKGVGVTYNDPFFPKLPPMEDRPD